MRSFHRVVRLGVALFAVAVFGWAPTAGADTRTPVYVALGDSFTSGYGARPYIAESGACSRSVQAYPEVVATPALHGVQNYACAAASTADLARSQPGDPSPLPQFDRLTANQTATTRVAYVSMTIGGADAGIPQCANQKKCKQPLKAVKANLVSSFERLASLAPGAKIMVMSYGIPFASAPTSACALSYPATLNKAFLKVNRTIKASMKAAARGQAGGATFLLVDDGQVFKGHEACSASADPWVGADWHPNAEGNVRMAADVDYCFAVPVAATNKLTDCTPPHP